MKYIPDFVTAESETIAPCRGCLSRSRNIASSVERSSYCIDCNYDEHNGLYFKQITGICAMKNKESFSGKRFDRVDLFSILQSTGWGYAVVRACYPAYSCPIVDCCDGDLCNAASHLSITFSLALAAFISASLLIWRN